MKVYLYARMMTKNPKYGIACVDLMSLKLDEKCAITDACSMLF